MSGMDFDIILPIMPMPVTFGLTLTLAREPGSKVKE